MWHIVSVMVLLALPAVAQAQEPMTGAEFDAYTRGKTLTYLEDGKAYGIEEYRPGRQVIWAFDGDECREGRWWEAAPTLICFLYEGSPDNPQCWNFFLSDDGLSARFAEDPEEEQRYAARLSTGPMICLGPDIGV